MSEIKISELQLGTPADTDVIPFVDLATNTTKKATKTDLKGDTGTAATADAGTTTTLSAGASATVVNSGTTSDAVFDFGIPQGVQGEDGAKITSVAFSGDNIVFTLDDSSAVTLIDAKIDLKGEDGATGADGAKITSAAFVGDDMVFTLSDSSTVTLSNAKITLKGATGSAGTITSITKTDTTGLVDTYTVAYNDSSTTTFTVTNGADGDGAGDTMSPATNTDNYLPQWDGADSKTLKNGVAIPAGGLAGLTEVGNKIAKTTNITALNETGIADGEIAVFNLTNKDIRTSDKTIVTTLGADDTTIPTSKAIADKNYLTAHQDISGKANLASPTFTGTVILPKAIEIQDTSADHQYVLAVSELTADRTITLPLLTGNDEIVFKAHTQTLTNKRINKRVVTTTDDSTAVIDCDSYDEYYLTAVANATTFSITGTPTPGQTLFIGWKDAGTAKDLTFTSITGLGVTLPTTTTLSKQGIAGLKYINSAWRMIALSTEA